MTPFGLPVEPDVYSRYAGSVSTASPRGEKRAGSAATADQSTPSPVDPPADAAGLSTTITSRIEGSAAACNSAASLPDVVTTAVTWQSPRMYAARAAGALGSTGT